MSIKSLTRDIIANPIYPIVNSLTRDIKAQFCHCQSKWLNGEKAEGRGSNYPEAGQKKLVEQSSEQSSLKLTLKLLMSSIRPLISSLLMFPLHASFKTCLSDSKITELRLRLFLSNIDSHKARASADNAEYVKILLKEADTKNVKVLLDNHVSEPKWCCDDDDENGFFHDRHFDPKEWVHGLTLAAQHFVQHHSVVAMSLRNELHGPRQNLRDWYRYMSEGALAVHKANPNVLVVISGLNYDTELQFLRNKPLKIDLGKKIVFETHLYSWSGAGTLKLKGIWTKQPLNRICANNIKALDQRAGFLTTGKNAAPLIFTEFGFDQTGSSVEDKRFFTCLQTYLVERDLDWGLWAFQGSYYVREDKVQLDETFGVMDATWHNLRSPNFTDKFQLLQRKNQDPTSKVSQAYIMYHPVTGQCAQVNDKNELEIGSCENQNRWIYSKDGSQILLSGTKKCLTASSEGLAVSVSDDCQSKNSFWKAVSLSKLHLATTDQVGKQLCLQKNSNSSVVVTSKCICIDNDSLCLDDPTSQWFQLVATNV